MIVLFVSGYAYSQGLSEAVLGGLQAAGALLGIIGAISYPKIRQCVGLERTGLFGLGAEILCLCLCVVSVWIPNSPFDLFGSSKTPVPETFSAMCQNSTFTYNANGTSVTSTVYDVTEAFINVTLSPGLNVTLCNETTSTSPEITPDISIWLLMIGIISARFGKSCMQLGMIFALKTFNRVNLFRLPLINGIKK